MASFTLSLSLVSVISFSLATPLEPRWNTPSVSNAQSSLTLMYQNNLNTTDDVNHYSEILLDPMSKEDASKACEALSESLLSRATVLANADDISKSLAYSQYAHPQRDGGGYWTADGALYLSPNGQLSFNTQESGDDLLQPLCTNSDQSTALTAATTNSTNEVIVSSNSNTYVGFRNKKAFRFLGMPYANPPERWVYSTPYSGQGQTLQANEYGSQCWQPGGTAAVDSENCLFVNIQTPYIPKAGSKDQLRPVLFYIHGGGFTGGTGADPGTDGGDLASREDVVTVTINYRLSTLGFLAIPGTDVSGNFGIADQIIGLEWAIQNVANFGGDPNQITIAGDSAGAGSVRVHLGSPASIGKFQGAVSMSNLGGGVTLGLSGDYGTTYSSYLTVEGSYAIAGQQIFTAVGCSESDINAQIACLKTVNASTLVNLPTVARYVVQDGHYVNTEELDVVNHNGSAAFVPVIFGTTHDEGASFSTYPPEPVANETQGISEALGITMAEAQRVVDSGLFPLYNTGNLTLDSFNVSARVATDKTFRCVDQATMYAASQSHAFKASYYYQTNRAEGGYDPNNLGGAPVEPGYPCGNPYLPYFRLHSSDIGWFFGGNDIACFRDPADLYSNQMVQSYFGSFIRTGDPNAPEQYLAVRGYDDVLQAARQTGPWEQVSAPDGPIRYFNWPCTAAPFTDTAQCAWLGYPIEYYLQGGK